MTKQLRTVIILVCVLAVLGGAIFFVTKSKFFKASTSSASKSYTQTKLMNDVSSDMIDKAVITNKSGSFSIVRTGSKAWTVSELKGAPIQSTTVGSAVDELAGISYSDVAEKNAPDLKKYGLDNPLATLDITVRDKGETVFLIGSKTPLGTGYYMMEKGKDTVYITTDTLDSYFMGSYLSYVDTALVSIDTTNDLPNITECTFGGSKRSQPIQITQRQKTSSASSGSTATEIVAVSPKLVIDTDKFDNAVKMFGALSADSAVSIDLSKASLAKYGLDNPSYTFSFTLNQKVTKLFFGNTFTDGGTEYIYLMMQGRNAVYRVATASVSFYNWGLSDLADTMQYSAVLNDLSSISIKTDAENLVFNFSGPDDSKQVSYNGKQLSMDTFRNFYQRFVNDLIVSGFEKQPSNAKLYCRIVCTYKDSARSPEVLEFYTYDSSRLYLKYNSTSDMYVLKLKIDTIVSLAKDVIAGKSVAMD